MLSLLSLSLGGPVLAWVRTVYTRLSGTNDRAPFRPERTGNFPVAADETAADMLCCALYPLTDRHLWYRGASLQVQRRGPVMAKYDAHSYAHGPACVKNRFRAMDALAGKTRP
jgi:hypothetical protein